MAVGTAPSLHIVKTELVAGSAKILTWQTVAMARCLMAALAEKGDTPLQEVGHIRAVRIVTDGAVLGDRLMVPEEGAAFFGMTGITGIDHGIALHQGTPGTTMWIMAITADHLALLNRVAIGLGGLDPLLFMAINADSWLLFSNQHRVMLGMHCVTRGTGDLTGIVLTPLPVQ